MFNILNGQEGWKASSCQILSKLLKTQPRHGVCSIFKVAAATILDFRNFKFLTVGTVKRVRLHSCAKFCQNCSNCSWGMAIIRFFKMAAAAILDFQNFQFLMVAAVKRAEVHHLVKFCRNCLNHSRDMAIFRFLKMATVRHLIFVMRVLWPPTKSTWWSAYHCAKFGWNRCSSFDNLHVFNFGFPSADFQHAGTMPSCNDCRKINV